MSARRLGLVGLGTLALGLAGIIAFELADPGEPAAPATMARDVATAPSVTPEPPASTAATLQNWADAILSRPLFTPGRHPPAEHVSDSVASKPSAPPRLAGIALGPTERHALFQPSGEAKPVILSVGGEVDGWRVAEIAADRVTVVGPAGSRMIVPQPDTARAAIVALTAPARRVVGQVAVPKPAQQPQPAAGTAPAGGAPATAAPGRAPAPNVASRSPANARRAQ